MVNEALQVEEKVNATLTDEAVQLSGKVHEIRLKTLEECWQICIETGGGDAE
jgi:hypothetical protein